MGPETCLQHCDQSNDELRNVRTVEANASLDTCFGFPSPTNISQELKCETKPACWDANRRLQLDYHCLSTSCVPIQLDLESSSARISVRHQVFMTQLRAKHPTKIGPCSAFLPNEPAHVLPNSFKVRRKRCLRGIRDGRHVRNNNGAPKMTGEMKISKQDSGKSPSTAFMLNTLVQCSRGTEFTRRHASTR
jgi:hypothetical protein